ncbi:MAG: HDIG domain-containing protein [Spirochaetes bacterium]|nr:HDIG domain-containing protein [Spirochaetota bacterium]MBU0955604.1 HDIG domain-containing protein [Spirochaetota bacterium]
MTRDSAIALWRQHNTDESLFRHALAVEAVMRHFAAKFGEDPEYWGLIGLLHDIDYQQHPEEHLQHTAKILSAAGFDQAFIRAILSHGWGICSEIAPELRMGKVLFACDELTGFITACAYVRPSKSVMDLELKSVKKKWNTAAFAAAVRRDIIEQGADMVGLPLDELISECILAMRGQARELGL